MSLYFLSFFTLAVSNSQVSSLTVTESFTPLLILIHLTLALFSKPYWLWCIGVFKKFPLISMSLWFSYTVFGFGCVCVFLKISVWFSYLCTNWCINTEMGCAPTNNRRKVNVKVFHEPMRKLMLKSKPLFQVSTNSRSASITSFVWLESPNSVLSFLFPTHSWTWSDAYGFSKL